MVDAGLVVDKAGIEVETGVNTRVDGLNPGSAPYDLSEEEPTDLPEERFFAPRSAACPRSALFDPPKPLSCKALERFVDPPKPFACKAVGFPTKPPSCKEFGRAVESPKRFVLLIPCKAVGRAVEVFASKIV
jgi:hypothetical protein